MNNPLQLPLRKGEGLESRLPLLPKEGIGEVLVIRSHSIKPSQPSTPFSPFKPLLHMTLTPRKKNLAILAIIIVILFLGSLLLNSMDDTTGSFSQTDRSASSVSFGGDMMIAETESAMYVDDNAYDISQSEQYVIKTGFLDITVEDIDTTADELTNIARTYGGTVTDRYTYTRGDNSYGTVDLKVSEDNFDQAMVSIKELAQTVNSENVSADDVTEQVIDIQARLTNSIAEEAAYVSILNQATSVEDILNTQYYLSNVREEIERYEAQLKYYESRTSYSTITVELTETTSIVLGSDAFQPWQAIKDSVQTVVRLFQGLILGIIELIVVGGAVIIPILILFFGGRWVYRKYKK